MRIVVRVLAVVLAVSLPAALVAEVPESVINRTIGFEGNIPHMYCDTGGNVTVGIGTLLATKDAATAFQFERKSDRKAATADEIKQDWAAVDERFKAWLKDPANKNKDKKDRPGAGYYAGVTKLEMPEADRKKQLVAHLQGVEKELQQSFPQFATYPQPAREALMDMGYNLGVPGLVSKFPNFTKAVKDRDWKTAARESRRTGIQESRNEAIRKLLEQAATP